MARRKQVPAAPPPARVISPSPPVHDLRPVIYAVLDQLFAFVFVIAIVKVIPNRLPSATIQLWTIPICMQVMAIGTFGASRWMWRPAGPSRWGVIAVAVAAVAVGFVVHLPVVKPLGSLVGLYGVFGALLLWKPAWRTYGRGVAIVAGSVLLLSVIVLIARVLVSAAFLAGVYGAFGQAAATFALVAVALVVELVALVPIFQLKYLMSRAGKRAFSP